MNIKLDNVLPILAYTAQVQHCTYTTATGTMLYLAFVPQTQYPQWFAWFYCIMSLLDTTNDYNLSYLCTLIY